MTCGRRWFLIMLKLSWVYLKRLRIKSIIKRWCKRRSKIFWEYSKNNSGSNVDNLGLSAGEILSQKVTSQEFEILPSLYIRTRGEYWKGGFGTSPINNYTQKKKPLYRVCILYSKHSGFRKTKKSRITRNYYNFI